MKAFLLAAGNGTRLKPLTESTQKCLLPIAGVPLLSIWLQLCRRHAIEEVLINVHAHARAVREYVKKNDQGVRIRLSEEPILLGSAGTILANRGWLSGDELFWVFYADVLTNMNLGALLDLHAGRPASATLAVYRAPDPTRCGVVIQSEDGVVKEFIEKPSTPSTNLAFCGVMLGTQEFLDAIPDHRPADIGFDVLPRLAGKMYAHETSDYVLDIGTLQNYMAAQTTWPGY